jgi:hypothetical protein
VSASFLTDSDFVFGLRCNNRTPKSHFSNLVPVYFRCDRFFSMCLPQGQEAELAGFFVVSRLCSMFFSLIRKCFQDRLTCVRDSISCFTVLYADSWVVAAFDLYNLGPIQCRSKIRCHFDIIWIFGCRLFLVVRGSMGRNCGRSRSQQKLGFGGRRCPWDCE